MGTRALSKHDKLLKELSRAPANKKCAICTCMGTQYTCQPPGIYICETCAGVIRSFPGFRVKSRTMATYTAEDVNALKDEGNERFVQTYLGKWNAAAFPAPTDKNSKSIETFVRQVLVEKLYYSDGQQNMQQSSPLPRVEALDTNSKIRAPALQSKSVSESGWQAFEGSTSHTHSTSFDQSRQNRNSDSWADFSTAPVTPSPARHVARASYDFDQFHGLPGSSIPPIRSPRSISKPPGIPTPRGWNAFDAPVPHTAQPNAALHAGGSASTPANASPADQNTGAAKAPIMKELPQDLFGPPQEHTPVHQLGGANPFNAQSFSPQGAMPVRPNAVQSPQYSLQTQQFMMQQRIPAQGLNPNQSASQTQQQQLFHQASFGSGVSRPDVPFQSQNALGGSFSPVSDNPRLLSGSFVDGDDSEQNLFGNLVGDLRTSMPKPQGPAGMLGGTNVRGASLPNYGNLSIDSQIGSFPNQQQSAFALSSQQQVGFDGEQGQPGGFRPVQFNKPMGSAHPPQNTLVSQMPAQHSGFHSYTPHGFPGMPQGNPMLSNGFAGQQDTSQFTVQSGLARQEPKGFQGGIQSSGNPFA